MVRLSLDTGLVSSQIPLVSEKTYNLGSGAKLFAIGLVSDIRLLVYSSGAIKLGVDYYRREVSIHGHSITIDYPGILALEFSGLYVHRNNVKYKVIAAMYGSAEYLGDISRDSSGVWRFDDSVIDTKGINRIYMKCKVLR